MPSNDKLNLLGILDSIEKIESYIENIDSYESFTADCKTMDACLMHLVNIGEMVARLSDRIVDDNTLIDWHKIKGLRNIIAHDYFGIDYREVWSVLSWHLSILKSAVNELFNLM